MSSNAVDLVIGAAGLIGALAGAADPVPYLTVGFAVPAVYLAGVTAVAARFAADEPAGVRARIPLALAARPPPGPVPRSCPAGCPISSVNRRCSRRGFIRAPREAARRAAAWSPYRSYAASYPWRLANCPKPSGASHGVVRAYLAR